MKRSIYNVLEIIKKIDLATSENSGKKKFQKLVYLMENLGGVDLGFKYIIHFYGPYSSELDDSVTQLIGEGFLYYNYVGSSHLICVSEEELDESIYKNFEGFRYEDFFAPDLTKAEYYRIDEVLEKFSGKTPSELELLTTAHYAYSVLPDKSEACIVAGVQKIKGKKYSEDKIISALHELTDAEKYWTANPI